MLERPGGLQWDGTAGVNRDLSRPPYRPAHPLPRPMLDGYGGLTLVRLSAHAYVGHSHEEPPG